MADPVIDKKSSDSKTASSKTERSPFLSRAELQDPELLSKRLRGEPAPALSMKDLGETLSLALMAVAPESRLLNGGVGAAEEIARGLRGEEISTKSVMLAAGAAMLPFGALRRVPGIEWLKKQAIGSRAWGHAIRLPTLVERASEAVEPYIRDLEEITINRARTAVEGAPEALAFNRWREEVHDLLLKIHQLWLKTPEKRKEIMAVSRSVQEAHSAAHAVEEQLRHAKQLRPAAKALSKTSLRNSR